MKKLIIAFLVSPLLFAACDNKDDNTPPPTKNFTVTIENVATPELFIGSGVFNTPDGDSGPGLPPLVKSMFLW